MIHNDPRRAARATLFAWLAAGERLAFETAAREARLTSDPTLQRLFRRQALQEARHAMIFDVVVRQFCRADEHAHLHEAADLGMRTSAIGRWITAAQRSDDLTGMVIGMQGVMEGIGVALLEAMGPPEHTNASLFEPIRRMVLAQERSHQHIGERALAALIADGRTSVSAVENALSRARECGCSLLARHEGVFEQIGRPLARMQVAVSEHAEAFLLSSRRLASRLSA